MANRINILTSDIYNRISAGEVVENPSSVVKELVENALDAKSTSITIEIEKGGKSLIKVVDNGGGIYYDDLSRVFMPHATSKISSTNDLDAISTLGFRGEALASIASVAQVEILSKTQQDEIGGKITIAGGKNQEITQYVCNTGTSINVKNLFFNTPARLKFLRSDKQEENAITNIVNRLMLANPNISFKYIIDGKIIYNCKQGGLKERIYSIYGKTASENIIEISAKNEKYKLYGFLSNPTFCKPNRTYQTLIVNSRYIANNLISVAMSNAYENFLMKGKFPFYVLMLDIDFNDVDVNVHPSKMEIKFKDSKDIYNFIYSSCLTTLNENNCTKAFLESKTNNSLFDFASKDEKEEKKEFKEITGGFSFGQMQEFAQSLQNIKVEAPKYKPDSQSFATSFTPDFEQDSSVEAKKDMIYPKTQSDNNSFQSYKSNTINEQNFLSNNTQIHLNNTYDKDDFNGLKTINQQQQFEDEIFYNIVGTLFSTYLIVEMGDNCYIIDQHAGHERVLYDKFVEEYKQNKLIVQPLLIPYVFEINPLEKNLIDDNLDVYKELGFDIEPFGNNAYKINSFPNILTGMDFEQFIDSCLKDTIKISTNNDAIKDKLARHACRSAVKSGDLLGEKEISILLKQVLKSDRILLCPHGRPICVKFSKYEIEKMFKRIV